MSPTFNCESEVMPSLNCVLLLVAKTMLLVLVWMVKFGAAIAVTLPWTSSISPLSSSELLAVAVVTLNFAVTVAEVGGVPVSTTELARSRSKLMTVELVLLTVIGPVKVTVTLGLVSVAGIFTGAGGTALFSTTISGFPTVSDAPEYVPGGMLTSAKGSNEPAWWTNSTSDVFESRLPVLLVPVLPVSVSELTESSNLTIWSFSPSEVLIVALVGPAVAVLLPPQPVASTIATVTTVKRNSFFIRSLQVFAERGNSPVINALRLPRTAKCLSPAIATHSPNSGRWGAVER